MQDSVETAAKARVPVHRELEKELETLVSKSHAIARRVLPILSENGIPVTPTNYRLWYEYFAGGSRDLKDTLDRLLQENTRFTPDLTQALYQRFFSLEAAESHTQLLNRAGLQVEQMTCDLLEGLGDSLHCTRSFCVALDGHNARMEKALDIDSVRFTVSRIKNDTKDVITSQENYQVRLEVTAEAVKELQQEIQKKDLLAHTDELTTLYNRRAFNLRIAEETNRAARYGNGVALIILDLDDFKRVNDNFGHLVGDRLLSIVASEIRMGVRGPDFPARYGGEEFAVICPQTGLEGAMLVAERLRQAIDYTQFTARGKQIKASISAGVSVYHPREKSESFIDRADRALYLAKRRGKNRVCSERDLEEDAGHDEDHHY